MTQPGEDDTPRVESSSDSHNGIPPDQTRPPSVTEDFSPQDDLATNPPSTNKQTASNQAETAPPPVPAKPLKPQDKYRADASESPQHPKPVRTAPTLEPGTVWSGKFQIEHLLGTGGMGKVFKAIHLQISAPVALKVMDAAVGTEKGTSRFMREARLLSAVNHPNVVRLLAFGQTADHVLYMALEFVNGQALSEILAQQIIDPTRAVVIAQQLCNGLTAAHNAGIIHRDLKPSNILLTQDEKGFEIVKVIDFGIARLADDIDRTVGEVESTSSVVGTPHYMSPEQCTGKKLDFASDIYSVGCLLYEMLCGQPPFPSEVPYTVMQGHINERLENVPSKHAVPAMLEMVVLKCLQKDPADRFASAKELAETLSNINWDTIHMVSQATARAAGPVTATSNKLFLLVLSLLIVIPSAALIVIQRLADNNADKVLRPEQRRTAFRSINLSNEQRQNMYRLSPAERVKWYRDWLSKYADKPDSCEAYFRLAQDLTESEASPAEIVANYAEASKKFREQIEIELSKPENERDYEDVITFALNRGLCIEGTGNPAEALKVLLDYAKQLEGTKCPKTRQADVLNGAARLYALGNDFKRAEEFANAAEEMIVSEGMRGDSLSEARLTHASYLFANGQRDAALVKIGQADTDRISDQKKAGSRNTDYVWPLSVAKSYAKMNSHELALQKFIQAEEMIPAGFRTMELTVGKVTCQLNLERWDDARDSIVDTLSQPGAKPNAAEVWLLLNMLSELAASGHTKIDIEPIVRRELSAIPESPNVIPQMIATGNNLLRSRQKELAGDVLERGLAVFRNTVLTKAPLTDSQQYFATQLVQSLTCAGRFESVDSFARQIYQLVPGSLPQNKQPSMMLRIYCLHAVAMSYAGKRREALQHIKAAVDMLTREFPNSPLQVEALLDRAMVQRNLRLDDDLWLRWATEAATRGALKAQAEESILTRIFSALCHRDPLFADQLTECGQQMFETNPSAKGVFDLQASSRYFYAGRYDRAYDLICSGLPYLKLLPAQDQRVILNNGIVACDKAGQTEKADTLKKLLEQTRTSR